MLTTNGATRMIVTSRLTQGVPRTIVSATGYPSSTDSPAVHKLTRSVTAKTRKYSGVSTRCR